MSLFSPSNSHEKLLQKYQQLLEEQTNKLLPDATSTEPIVGLRVWHVMEEGGLPKLKSVTRPVLWPYRKALERDPIMANGIHAIKQGDAIVSLFHNYSAHVAGEVYLWGKVEEHDVGYLADCAYPKRLFVPPDFCPIKAMQLEDEYGVPCEYREEFVIVQPPQLVQQMYSTGVISNNISQSASVAYQQMLNAQANMQAAMMYPQALMGGLAASKYPWQP